MTAQRNPNRTSYRSPRSNKSINTLMDFQTSLLLLLQMFGFRLFLVMCSIVPLCHLLFILAAIKVISYFGSWFVSETLFALFRILAPGIFHTQTL